MQSITTHTRKIRSAREKNKIIQKESSLYYWRRNRPGSEAEVDYLIEYQSNIVPIEVKAGKGSTLKSMHSFLQTHFNTPYGIRFSTQNFSVHEKVWSYPLYAVMLLTSTQKFDR